MTNQDLPDTPDTEEIVEDENLGLPSLFKNWTQMYVFVLGELVLLIGLFYMFTKLFE